MGAADHLHSDPAVYAYVGRQPILNAAGELRGYELLYRDGDGGPCTISGPRATYTTIVQACLDIGLDGLVASVPAFMNAGRDSLMSEGIEVLPPARVVIEVLENVSADYAVVRRLQGLRECGYTIALDDFVYEPSLEPLLELADIVKVDVLACGDDALGAQVDALAPWNCTLLAEKVEDAAQFERCRRLGFELFQGYYFCRPTTVELGRVPAARTSALQLLSRLQEPDIAPRDVERLVASDVALSYRLLRYLDSASFALCATIASVQQALVYLGLSAVRKWVTVLVLAGFDDDSPRELVVTALIRGRMAELLAQAAGAANPDSYFAVGMFSLLEALLGMPMARVLEQLPLSDELARALLTGDGDMGDALAAVIAWERGDWDDVCYRGLPVDVLAGAYLDALGWAHDATGSIA